MQVRLFLYDFTSLLTSEHSVWTFFGAFAVGVIVLVTMQAPMVTGILAAAPIVVYGCLLYVAQVHHRVGLSDAVKTSPYILGFLLTLVALLMIFLRGRSTLITGDVDADLLTAQVGAAILTTVVGLAFRQVLLATDPIERTQEEAFRSISEDLRKHAADFDTAQRRLLELIEEFVETREGLFEKEEKAHARYHRVVEQATDELLKTQEQWISSVESVQEEVRTAQDALQHAAASTTKSLNSEGTALANALTELRGALTGLGSVLEEGGTRLSGRVRGLSEALTSLRSEALNTGEALSQAQKEQAALTSAAAATQRELTSFPPNLHSALESFVKDTVGIHKDSQAQLRSILEDVQAMDAIIDEVAQLLQKRLLTLGES